MGIKTKPRPRTDELVRPGYDGYDTFTEEQLKDMVVRCNINWLYITDNFGRNVTDIVGFPTEVVYRDGAVWVTWTPMVNISARHEWHSSLVLALAANKHSDGKLDMKSPGLISPVNKIQPPVVLSETANAN